VVFQWRLAGYSCRSSEASVLVLSSYTASCFKYSLEEIKKANC